jgi:hypothetical protein
MAWFMPQYPYAYEGPIFAENGTGIFSVGQGDCRSGDGGFLDAGDPVLFVQLGSKKVIYLVPEFKRDVWQHIAVVRKSNTLKLYVNGIYKTPVKVNKKKRNTIAPDSEIDASAITSSLPYGTLRFGRRTHADRGRKMTRRENETGSSTVCWTMSRSSRRRSIQRTSGPSSTKSGSVVGRQI